MVVDFITNTTGGVVEADEPTGTISIELGEGDTIATVVVVDGAGNLSKVYVDYHQAVRTMSALGAVTQAM